MNTPRRLLIALAVLAGLATSCGIAPPRYRPGPAPELPVVHVDPRPDLPGVPITAGHPLYSCLELLLKAAPPGRPLAVRSSPLMDPYLGRTRNDVGVLLAGGDPRSLVIEVRDDLEGWVQRDVLLHEYAHVLAWDVHETPHGAVWGAYFAYLYRLTRNEF